MTPTAPRALPAVLLALAVAAMAACSRAEPRDEEADDRRTLNVLMWSDYVDPEIVELFEQKFDARVVIDTYETSDTMQTRMQLQDGAARYDLLIASDHKVPELAALELIQPLDLSQVPNAANVMERFQAPPYDPDGVFSLPYQWGTLGLLYRTDRLPDFEATWAAVFDPSRAAEHGPFLLIADMRDCFAAALKYLGHSVNATDPAIIQQAGDVILAATQNSACLGFEGSPSAVDQVAQGAVALAMVYSGDAFKAINDDGGDALAYIIPQEGGEWWVDAMLLPAQAKDADLAYAFMNYVLDPQLGGQLAEYNQAGTPNQAALPYLAPETRANQAIYPPEDVLSRLEPLRNVGDARQVYDQAWTQIKAR